MAILGHRCFFYSIDLVTSIVLIPLSFLRILSLPRAEVLAINFAHNANYISHDDKKVHPQMDSVFLAFKSLYGSIAYYDSSPFPSPAPFCNRGYLSFSQFVYRRPLVLLFLAFVRLKCGTKKIFGINLPERFVMSSSRLRIKTFEIHHGYGPVTKYDKYLGSLHYNIVFDDLRFLHLNKLSSFINVLRGRNLYLDRSQFIYNYDLSSLFPANKVLRQSLNIDKHTVLVTLQWGFDGELASKGFPRLDNGFIDESFLAIVKDLTDLNWIFRYHPLTLEDRSSLSKVMLRLGNHFCDSSHVFYDPVFSSMEITEIIAFADLHCTMSSCSTFECALLGVPTILMDNRSLEQFHSDVPRFHDLFSNGMAYYCDPANQEEFLSIVEKVLKQECKPTSIKSFLDREISLPSCHDLIYTT